jgi:hypothetical protein
MPIGNLCETSAGEDNWDQIGYRSFKVYEVILGYTKSTPHYYFWHPLCHR